MTWLKGAAADRYLAKPEAGPRIVLLYGPDPGGVTERAVAMTERLVGKDPLAVVRMDGDEPGAEPGRIADEVYAGSLFSGRRVVRLRAGSKQIAPALKPILERPPEDTWLIIEAGDLRKTAPLRKLCEDSHNAAAIGTYADTDASLGRMIDEEVRASGLSIAPDARELLIGLIGADRAASRSEVRKLCLYATPGGTITRAEIAAVIGDGAAFATDDVIDAALTGDAAGVDRGLRRILSSGTGAGSVATSAERAIISLHRWAGVIDRGMSVSSVLQSMRPPPMMGRREVMETQLRRWPLPAAGWAVARIGDAVRDSRNQPANAPAIVSEALLAIALRAARNARSD